MPDVAGAALLHPRRVQAAEVERAFVQFPQRARNLDLHDPGAAERELFDPLQALRESDRREVGAVHKRTVLDHLQGGGETHAAQRAPLEHAAKIRAPALRLVRPQHSQAFVQRHCSKALATKERALAYCPERRGEHQTLYAALCERTVPDRFESLCKLHRSEALAAKARAGLYRLERLRKPDAP